jgi:predicted SAM-dependent methyltransferase
VIRFNRAVEAFVGRQRQIILNLGCGAKVSPHCINIDRSLHLRIVRSPILYWLAKRTLSAERVQNLAKLECTIVVHDLTKGIPFPDKSVDVVYHSHILEHIDRNIFRDGQDPSDDRAVAFVRECRRVLRPGGVLRIVVPDFEKLCRRYLDHLARCEIEPAEHGEHDQAIFDVIGQEVMKEAPGSSKQRPIIRHIENLFLGDARSRGQTHQWEYDKVNMKILLQHAGFDRIDFLDYETSHVADWDRIGLDRRDTGPGEEYRPGSLYVEAIR